MIIKVYKLLIWTSVLFLFACSEKSEYVLLQSEQSVKDIEPEKIMIPSTEYMIMPQDRLKIVIYRNPEVSGIVASDIGETLLVDSKGFIYLPLVKKVKVAGLTQREASKRLTERFKKYLKVPLISLEVLNKRIYVIGEVNKPGPIALDKEKMTILQALAYAGDLTDAAVRNNIVILSKNNINKPYLRQIDLTNFDSLSSNNMMLLPNDIVYVQPNGWKEFKVSSDNFTAPFKTMSEIASPFVQMHYLFD